MWYPNPLVLLLGFVTVVAGLLTLAAASRPKLFWPALILVSIISSGMMPFGYTIVDEYLLGCLLFGMLLSIVFGSRTRLAKSRGALSQLHLVLFLTLTAYLLFQSTRGSLEFERLQMVRWIVFYGMIGLLAILMKLRKFVVPQPSKLAAIVAWATILYLALYVVHGAAVEFVGGSRWDLQLVWWGTPAYSLLPVSLGVAASIRLLIDSARPRRLLGWMTLSTILAAGLYYDARVAILSFLGLIIVAFPVLGGKRLAVATLLSAGILLIFFSLVWGGRRDLQFVVEDLFSSGSALWGRQQVADRDIDRFVHMESVLASGEEDDWTKLLFGYGYRAHGLVIGPYLRGLYAAHGRFDLASSVGDNVSTEGFTAIFVDTGLTGLFLVLANLSLLAYRVLRQSIDRYRYVVFTAVLMLFLWLFVINVLDVVLYYIAIMPSGILLLLARPDEEKMQAAASRG